MRALFAMSVPKIDGTFLTDDQIREIFRDAGLSGSRDATLLADSSLEELLKGYREQACRILKFLPTGNDQQDKVARQEQMTIFASVHVPTESTFMVVRETEGEILLRLHNSRIELLQRGCRDLVQRLRSVSLYSTGQWPHSGVFRFQVSAFSRIVDDIEVYEHGLATPTIRGTFVNSKLGYAWRHWSRDRTIFFGAAVSIGIILYIRTLFEADSQMFQQLDRVNTALITATVLAIYQFFYLAMSAAPLIEWSFHYERDSS